MHRRPTTLFASSRRLLFPRAAAPSPSALVGVPTLPSPHAASSVLAPAARRMLHHRQPAAALLSAPAGASITASAGSGSGSTVCRFSVVAAAANRATAAVATTTVAAASAAVGAAASAAAPAPSSRAAMSGWWRQSRFSSSTAVLKKVPKSKRFEIAVAPGNMPHSSLKTYKPHTNALRHRVTIDTSHLWPGKPVKALTQRITGQHQAGRNHHGRITVWGRMAPKHRRMYRKVDFRRARLDPAVVQRFEYDPNRSAFIALVEYQSDGALSYILAPRDLAVGSVVRCGEEAPFAPGNAMPLALIPDGAEIHNIELMPGRGGTMVRSAGMAARLMSKDDRYAQLKLPSGEIRKVLKECAATIGVLSNEQWHNRALGKAGASAWVGRRPKVRGVAMNPVDHPMGGGEGKSSGGRPSSSPWGWYTKGLRTRNTKQHSSKLIVRRRNHDKLQLSSVNRGSW